jgi:hypothetical protein
LKKLPLRIVLPALAVAFFSILSIATTRQAHVIDWRGWQEPSGMKSMSESEDIGTPADVLLLSFNLPALIALLPLLPVGFWINSEIVLRSVWGLGAIEQWFLIGRSFDVRRGLTPPLQPPRLIWLHRLLFIAMIAVGGGVAGFGLFGMMRGHHSFWGMLMDASFLMWGTVLVVSAQRWKSASSSVGVPVLPL